MTALCDGLSDASQPRIQVTLRDLTILTAEGDLVPLVLNPPQRELMAWLGIDPDDPAPNLRGLRWRKRILKARREGITTLLMALFFQDTYNHPERFSVVAAHDSESATAIFGIVQRFYKHLPPEKQHKASRSEGMELLWPSINSRFLAATAGADDLLSGGTIHNLHKSERAKWKGKPEDIASLDASLNIAARWGNIVEETTAKGLNHFYKDWKASVAGKSPFQPFFLPWFKDPRNREPVPAGFTRTDEEQQRAEAYGLDDEQLAFYRVASDEHKGLVKQEYPHSAEEAFIASGNPAFNREYLLSLANIVASPDWAPEREETPEKSAWNGTVTTYVEPDPEAQYLIIADPAQGIDQYGDHDYAVAHVYDRSTWEQVAHYRGRPDPHNFGIDLDVLGRIYNTAMICVLRNNHGHSVLNTLLNQCRYPHIHYHTHFDEYTKKEVKQAGYPETTRSKPEAVDDLTSVIEGMSKGEKGFLWRHPNTIEELVHYVKVEGGKTEGESGSHDDECSCCYVAAALIPTYALGPRARKRIGELQPLQPRTTAAGAEGAQNRLPVQAGRFGRR